MRIVNRENVVRINTIYFIWGGIWGVHPRLHPVSSHKIELRKTARHIILFLDVDLIFLHIFSDELCSDKVKHFHEFYSILRRVLVLHDPKCTTHF